MINRAMLFKIHIPKMIKLLSEFHLIDRLSTDNEYNNMARLGEFLSLHYGPITKNINEWFPVIILNHMVNLGLIILCDNKRLDLFRGKTELSNWVALDQDYIYFHKDKTNLNYQLEFSNTFSFCKVILFSDYKYFNNIFLIDRFFKLSDFSNFDNIQDLVADMYKNNFIITSKQSSKNINDLVANLNSAITKPIKMKLEYID